MTCDDTIKDKDKPSIAHKKAIKYLHKHASKRSSGIIPFPEVFRVLAWLFHFKKTEAHQFITEMNSSDLVEIFAFHGIKIKGGEYDK